MLTSAEKEADYRNTVENHEGVPIRLSPPPRFPRFEGHAAYVRLYVTPNHDITLPRRLAHQLHAELTEALGMASPRPTSPMTASAAAVDSTQAARNRRFDVV